MEEIDELTVALTRGRGSKFDAGAQGLLDLEPPSRGGADRNMWLNRAVFQPGRIALPGDETPAA